MNIPSPNTAYDTTMQTTNWSKKAIKTVSRYMLDPIFMSDVFGGDEENPSFQVVVEGKGTLADREMVAKTIKDAGWGDVQYKPSPAFSLIDGICFEIYRYPIVKEVRQ